MNNQRLNAILTVVNLLTSILLILAAINNIRASNNVIEAMSILTILP